MKKVVLFTLLSIACIAPGMSQILTNRPAPMALTEKVNNKSLISFSLEIASPDENGGMSSRTSTEPAVFFFNGAYQDTIQTITSIEMNKQSILELYQKAFSTSDYFRILYNEELNYIASKREQEAYNMKITVSSLVGETGEIMQKQLNMTFGLKTTFITRDTTAYILKKIVPSEKLRPLKSPNNPNTSLASSWSPERISSKGTSRAHSLANMIENALQYPVLLEGIDEQTIYEYDLEIKNEAGDNQSWLKAFEKEGFILEKGIRKVKYILIEKETP